MCRSSRIFFKMCSDFCRMQCKLSYKRGLKREDKFEHCSEGISAHVADESAGFRRALAAPNWTSARLTPQTCGEVRLDLLHLLEKLTFIFEIKSLTLLKI